MKILNRFNKLIISSLFSILILSSCSKENPIIDNSDNSFKVLVATGENHSELSVIEQPSGKIINANLLSSPIYSEINKKSISRIAVFGSHIYVLIPEAYKILVYNRWNYNFTDSISFENEKIMPIDIAFSNATDAFLIFKDYSKVAIVDIKFYKTARFIDIGESPSSIAYYSSKILITNNKSNTVSIINSQNYTFETEIQVSASPLQIVVAPNSPTASIICGKNAAIDSTASDIPNAKIDILDLSQMQITRSFELRSPIFDANKIYPSGASISSNNILLVATQQGLFKSNIKTLSLPILTKKYGVSSITATTTQDKFLIIDSESNGKIISPVTVETEMELNIPKNVQIILAL